MVLSIFSRFHAASLAMCRVIDGATSHGMGTVCILREPQPVHSWTAWGCQSSVACAADRYVTEVPLQSKNVMQENLKGWNMLYTGGWR